MTLSSILLILMKIYRVCSMKTEYIVFAPSKKARTPSHLKVNDVNMGESSSVRDLGIILDNKLNFKEEIKKYSPEWRAASKS